MKNNQMHRQGDVLFTAIEALPEGLKERKGKVIIEGEATGHHHSLVAGRVLEDAQGYLFLEVLRATQVVHQEHNAINLKPGYYQVTRQREYTPEAIRMVID
jgi:hypothetical protein